MQIARQKGKHSAMPSRLMTVMAEVGRTIMEKMRWHSNSSYVSVSKVGLGTCSHETYYVTQNIPMILLSYLKANTSLSCQ